MRMDAFTRGYIEAALWSSTAYGHPDEAAAAREGRCFDRSFNALGYTWRDLAPATLARMIADCARFQTKHAEDLTAYVKQRAVPSTENPWAYAGLDFWLTRNGHGAGFWDRELGPLGDRLTNAAHAYGEVDLYLGDDGVIYA